MQVQETRVKEAAGPDPLVDETPLKGAVEQRKARHLLLRRIREQPDDEQVWLDLASASSDPQQAHSYLRQALRLNPRNRDAQRTLRRVEAQLASHTGVLPSPSGVPALQDQVSRRPLASVWLFVAAVVVFMSCLATLPWMIRSKAMAASVQVPTIIPSPTATSTPTPTPTPSVPERVATRMPALEQAWEKRDWSAATVLLISIGALDTEYPGLHAARCDTYLHWADDLVQQGNVQQAYALYREALAFCEDTTTTQARKTLALNYLAGKWRYDHQQWVEAAPVLQTVYETNPEYAETGAMLYSSYLATSRALLATNQLHQARGAAEAALKVRPEDPETTALLQEIRVRLTPPTPTPTPTPANTLGKRIEVNISEQRMYVWQGDTLVYKWVCSTGEPGRPTAAGHWQVRSKIVEAWASTWSLRMPYWMGIYQAGSLENGIHALPILPNGQTLWAGFLGTPVSYGCVILSTENARTLFNWAEIGTPVWVHY